MRVQLRLAMALAAGFLAVPSRAAALPAADIRTYECSRYRLHVFDWKGVTYPAVTVGNRTFQFAYRTDGYGKEGERNVLFHGMKARDFWGRRLEDGNLAVSFVHDLFLKDGAKEKVGEALTEIHCASDAIGVRTTVTPLFPGRFCFTSAFCFSQVVVFPDFDRWVGSTLLTVDARSVNRVNLLMPHDRFDFNRWGMNGRDLRQIVFGNVPDVMKISAKDRATLIVNRYKGGFECGAALAHPHPRHYPTPWSEPLTYRYAFGFDESDDSVALAPAAPAAPSPQLRFGVLADIHVNKNKRNRRPDGSFRDRKFRRALEVFRDAKVGAGLCLCGLSSEGIGKQRETR